MLADHLKHLRGAEAVNVDVLRHLGHVAAIGRLVEHYVDSLQRRRHDLSIAQISFSEFNFSGDPRRLAFAVSLTLEVVKHTNGPSFAAQ